MNGKAGYGFGGELGKGPSAGDLVIADESSGYLQQQVMTQCKHRTRAEEGAAPGALGEPLTRQVTQDSRGRTGDMAKRAQCRKRLAKPRITQNNKLRKLQPQRKSQTIAAPPT